MSAEWVVRPYEAEDEACVVSMWLKGYARSRDMEELRLLKASELGHRDQVRFWKIHQPIVMGILAGAEVVVACDPKRVHAEPGTPAVIWAWACVSEDTVHWVGVKRTAVDAGIGPDLVRAVLGERMDIPQRTTFDLVDMSRMRLIPPQWFRERGFLSALRSVSTRVLDGDRAFAAAGAHVVDLQRKAWVESTERGKAA